MSQLQDTSKFLISLSSEGLFLQCSTLDLITIFINILQQKIELRQRKLKIEKGVMGRHCVEKKEQKLSKTTEEWLELV